MDVDLRALRDLVRSNGEEVFSTSYDGGGPGHSGSAGVIKFADSYWGFDDNGEFGGPFDSLEDALDDCHLQFGEVDLSVDSSEMTSERIASLVQMDATSDHTVTINGEEWSTNKHGKLVPTGELEEGEEEEVDEEEEEKREV